MLHDNCSHYVITKTDTISPYWDSNKDEYSKRFSKVFYHQTVFQSNFGYLTYRRRRPAATPENESKQNRWVVPYSPYLSAKYDAHINVKICVNVKACKYIFKYVHKGSDRVSLRIIRENDNRGQNAAGLDSVNEV